MSNLFYKNELQAEIESKAGCTETYHSLKENIKEDMARNNGNTIFLSSTYWKCLPVLAFLSKVKRANAIITNPDDMEWYMLRKIQ